jgi:hypothetical protein
MQQDRRSRGEVAGTWYAAQANVAHANAIPEYALAPLRDLQLGPAGGVSGATQGLRQLSQQQLQA